MKSKNSLLYLGLTLVFLACQSNTKEIKEQTISLSHHVDDRHSYANTDEVTVDNLNLDIAVSFEHQSVTGTAEWEISPKAGVERLVLDTRSMDILNVEVDGKSVSFEQSKPNDIYGQGLFIPIDSTSKRVRIQYATQPGAEALQWLTAEQTKGKLPFLYTQSQAILARSWVPCQDLPAVRFNYKARVQVPEGHLAVMSASNPISKNDSGIYHFEMNQKIPSYLMALSVGDIAFKALNDRVAVYALPDVIERAAEEFETLPEMVVQAEKLYGAYRWDRYDVLVLPASFPFGGMENPRLTFATPTIIAGDGSLVSLLAHELAHSWSGNLVTNRTWDDFWLNEGFTVYFEQRIMEAVYGKDYADMLTVLGWQDLQETLKEMGEDNPDTRLKLDLTGRDPDDGLTDIAYEKGRFFLRHLEEVLGRERMDAFLNSYFQSKAFQTVTTEEFLEELQKEIGNDSALWKKADANSWVYEPGLPEYAKAPESAAFERVDDLRASIMNDERKALDQTINWTTHEWLYFLRKQELKDTMAFVKLNKYFGLNTSGNSEIAALWYRKAIEANYTGVESNLKAFLMEVGRRKFLQPLYAATLESSYYKERAMEWYKKARAGYHAVSIGTLDKLLVYKP